MLTSSRLKFAVVTFLLALILCIAGRAADAEDWRMFGRDGTRNGVSPEKNPPLAWQIPRPGRTRDDRPARNIKWSAGLGSYSYGDPVVADGLVWIGTNSLFRDEKDLADGTALVCFRETDGKQLYRYVTPRLGNALQDWLHDWSMSSLGNSPLVDGDWLWFTTNRAEVVCLDIGPLKRGEGEPRVAWKLDMFRDLNVRPFGADAIDIKRGSVAGYKDWIYVCTSTAAPLPGNTAARRPRNDEKIGPAPSLLCLEKSTGRIVWKDDLPREAILEYQPGSPLVAEIGGRAQVIVGQGDGWLRSFDAATGALLWKFDINPKGTKWAFGSDQNVRNQILATPVLYENRIYIGGGRAYHHGGGPARLCCIDPTRSGDISSELAVDAAGREMPHRTIQAVDAAKGEKAIANPNSGLVWEYTGSKGKNAVPMFGMLANVAVAKGLVIAPDVEGYVRCLDAKTGKEQWRYDAMATLYASPLVIDDHVFIGDEEGEVAILRLSADPKVAIPNGEPVSMQEVGSKVLCSPVFANGTLYIANQNRLFAIREIAGR